MHALTAVLIAQFFSAFADNVLLFTAIAVVKKAHYAAWAIPLLQEFFVLAYIILAPFVGPLADAFSKNRVMLVANGIKLIAAIMMLFSANPFFVYALVGAGAAAYSPAKYGILPQLMPPGKLVRANSAVEGLTIAAILLGVVLGGYLADQSILIALCAVIACYFLAMFANLKIPVLAVKRPLTHLSLTTMWKEFWPSVGALWKDKPAQFSLLGTAAFWGCGATLRFLLIAWVPIALGDNSNALPANMNGGVAVGIVLGAILAAKFVNLDTLHRSLPAGCIFGIAIILFAGVTHLYTAFALLIIVGAAGGLSVVPLNAVLQNRGEKLVGAGNAVAVQNLFENTGMLILLTAYTALSSAHADVIIIGQCLGVFITLMLGGLWWDFISKRRAQSLTTD